ncbi:hypothetical protein ACLOJK_004620 [Asimina triloba]
MGAVNAGSDLTVGCLAWIDRGHRILDGRTRRQMGLGDDRELGIWRRRRTVLVRVDESADGCRRDAGCGWPLVGVMPIEDGRWLRMGGPAGWGQTLLADADGW